ncbi:MAG: helix-hairpin-helix domain-containing protein [Desulfobacterales bacterium]|nr:helix-hairpin-helix domain-containing protein [Desulfobacterales bacterium]
MTAPPTVVDISCRAQRITPDLRPAVLVVVGLCLLVARMSGLTSPPWDSRPGGTDTLAGAYSRPGPGSLPPAVRHIFFRPVPINLVDQEVLAALPGIGPRLAERIVLLRHRQGKITRPGQLLAIPGISARKLARLRPWLSFAEHDPPL